MRTRERTTRVLVADDHPVVRRGLGRILEETDDLELAGEAATAAEAMTLAGEGRGDVLVLDLSFPDAQGLELLRRLHHEEPDLPVVVLSVHPADRFALAAMRSGAAAYVEKGRSPEELVAAIRTAALGKRYLSPELADLLLDEAAGAARLPHERLSEREFQVMCRIAAGHSVSGIAEELGLSVKTISTYRARLLSKMELTSNAQVTRYALEHDLVT